MDVSMHWLFQRENSISAQVCLGPIHHILYPGPLSPVGGDDQQVFVWRVPEAIQGQGNLSPICMNTKHRSNIFTIDFSCDNAFIFSGGKSMADKSMYCFYSLHCR